MASIRTSRIRLRSDRALRSMDLANTKDIVIPELGDFEDVEVIEILVKAGDRVAREDPLITLETDKAAMDVPASDNGVITTSK